MKTPRGDPKGERIKAPPNGFVLFRSDYKAISENEVTADGRKKKETEITKDAAVAWKQLPQITRDDYLGRARRNLADHKRDHREYWSQRRGPDGRFSGALEPDNLPAPYRRGELDGAASSLLVPRSTPTRPFRSPGSFPGLSGSLLPNSGFVQDALAPAFHTLSTPSSGDIRPFSFPVPFHGIASDNALPRVPLFDPLPGTSVGSIRSPVPGRSLNNTMFAAPATAIPYDDTRFLPPTMDYSTSFDATYPNLNGGGLGDMFSTGNTLMPLQPPSQSTQDLSSRTLTLSDSQWEAIDLFLSINDTSQANADAVRP